jgi:aminotransferase
VTVAARKLSRRGGEAAPINVFQPTLGIDELAAVERAFASGWVGKGQRTADFEAAFAEHLGVERDHVRSTSCCTEGLFLAMELLGIGPDDEVVIPSIAFVGLANAVVARGARAVFCDVDRRTLNPRLSDLARALTPRTRAVAVLHYGGYPGDLEAIAELCRTRGIALVEDAACAVASRTAGGACGTLGDIGVWSFDAMKVVVTCDGGMMHFRDPELAARAERLMCLGLEAPSGHARREADRWWELSVSEPGRRALMNDVAAAIGCVQLQRLPGFLARREEVRAAYDAGLAGVPGIALPPAAPPGQRATHYFYWIQLPEPARDRMARELRARGVYTTFKYHPLHTLPLYGGSPSLPEAEAAAATTLCLPMHQALSDDDIQRVIEGVIEIAADGAGMRP